MEAVMTSERDETGRESAGLTEGLPMQRLAQEAKSLLEAFAEKILASVGDKVSDKVNEVSHGLLDKADGQDGGGPGVKAAFSGVKALTEGKGPFRAILGAGATGLKEKAKGIFGKKGGGKKGLKLINIVESIDVGVPLRLAYDQWTEYEEFPTFMKKVEHVDRPEDEKTNWKAQVFWSHRTWEATTLEQVPDDHIIWRSKGAKGYVDGVVSFSELAPNLTRILLVMEYHPQGFFERTGNLWRAPGRRARLEFKHFRRQVMAHTILNPDEVEGWRGEIRDGEVVKTHEDALEEEKLAREEKSETSEEEPRAEEAEAREAPEEERTEPSGEEAEGEPEEPEEEPDESDEAAEAEPEEPEAEPEEPEAPRRARGRAPAAGEHTRPAGRRPPSQEERPRARPARRRPPAGGDEAEEQPAPARRPRRRPPREREGESE
jgi:uncharacterized membrane protein